VEFPKVFKPFIEDIEQPLVVDKDPRLTTRQILHGKMRQEHLDLSRPPYLRMAFVMEQDGSAHPVGTGAFRTNCVVSQPHDLPSSIEPFRLGPWPVRAIDIRLVIQHDLSTSSL
jgi:hypothetical protein